MNSRITRLARPKVGLPWGPGGSLASQHSGQSQAGGLPGADLETDGGRSRRRTLVGAAVDVDFWSAERGPGKMRGETPPPRVPIYHRIGPWRRCAVLPLLFGIPGADFAAPGAHPQDRHTHLGVVGVVGGNPHKRLVLARGARLRRSPAPRPSVGRWVDSRARPIAAWTIEEDVETSRTLSRLSDDERG
ncbi:MAG: hypothetical protein Ct9H300mP1_08430 [Planctomycetaceae bacterium]|nr:MAG: hypothetical protein Ct9H300mP1_08430 [Planctomycetaceae bacterium]